MKSGLQKRKKGGAGRQIGIIRGEGRTLKRNESVCRSTRVGNRKHIRVKNTGVRFHRKKWKRTRLKLVQQQIRERAAQRERIAA